jgi:hypothetical protein
MEGAVAKPTIKELEAMLNNEEDKPITILPNGEIAAADKVPTNLGGLKPLTMKEDLGGEYSFAEKASV